MDFIDFLAKALDVKPAMAQLIVLAVCFLFVALLFTFFIVLIVGAFRMFFKKPGTNKQTKEKKNKASKKEKQPEPEETPMSAPATTTSAKEEVASPPAPPAETVITTNEEPMPANLVDTPVIAPAAPLAEVVATAAEEPVAETEAEPVATVEAPAFEPVPAGPSVIEPKPVEEPSDSHLQRIADNLLAKKDRKSEVLNKAGKVQNRSGNAKANNRTSSKNLKKKASKLKIPKTAQDTIPYLHVYPKSGIIEIEPGKFTKSYLLDDVNYQVAKDEEQAEMFLKYGEFLNSFDPTVRVQITVNQRNINMEEFEEQVLLPLGDDKLDELRIERNELLKNKIRQGKNNLVKEKYITVCVQAPNYDAALTIFARMDSEIPTNIKKIGGAGATALSSAERLETLHDLYNLGDEGMFGNNMTVDKDGNLCFAKEKFSFEIMRRMGLTTKDMIAPESFTFKSDHGMVGDKYFRALFLRKVPSFLADNVLAELTNTDCNMITSLIFEPVEGEKALQMARNQIRNINANVENKQRKLSKDGVSHELISMDLQDASAESKELFRDLSSKNQKMFFMTLCIVHFSESKEDLDSDTKAIQTIGNRLLLDIKKLSWQQENGLATVLPLCNNKLEMKRSLTTESASVFMPFVNQELNDRKGGLYYGNNAVSHNLILYNRRKARSGNGFILGSTGSGKSMAAKQEMMTVRLSTDDVVIVIDPEGEYYPMAEMLDGEVVRIATGADVHINPFDINMDYDSDDDPISIKSDFIVSLCEAVVGERYGLNASQRSMIDRCVKKVYEPFLNSRNETTGEFDHSLVPTMVDFYNELRKQNGYDAMQLADGLEIYVTGSMNVFAHRTNVQYNKKFVVYDIKDIGSNMKTMGLLVVLDNIWNRIMEGRREGRNVWFYIDEIYLLFQKQSSAEFLRNLYKRARKYGGIPTGITQNVTDILESDIARTMISNCDFILMLNQGPGDRAILGQLLNISPTQMSYITNAAPGEGLLYDGSHLVPFKNKLPKDTKQYLAMTTTLNEVQEREAAKDEAPSAVS